MIAHLNYQVDKEYYRNIFYQKQETGGWHKEGDVILDYWWKVFDIDDDVMPITKDLGIDHLVTKPRFSYQLPNSTLPNHIDQDRIIGININLMPILPTVIINKKLYKYDSCLIDVGSKIHSVKSNNHPRLVLKYAIRSTWNEIYSILNNRGLIDHKKTEKDNKNYKNYVSNILSDDIKYVRNKGSIVKKNYKY